MGGIVHAIKGAIHGGHYIEFDKVEKSFGDHKVLDRISFHVDHGETVAIMGRSGVGKSVTLQHIMGFLKPDAGRIWVAGEDITEYDESRLRQIRHRITMVFQSGALFDSLSIFENVAFPLREHRGYTEENITEVVKGLLEMLDLSEVAETYPSELSTGMKRSAAIARALAASPEAILYDEPTTMVDPLMSQHVAELIERLKRQLKLTGVVVTHDLELMRKVADTVVVLFEGKAIYFGPVADLENSEHPHIQEFLAMDRVA